MDIALTPEARANRKVEKMADWVMGYYKHLGKPDFGDSEAFWDMVTEVIRVWGEWYRQEFEDMVHNNKIDKRDEKSLSGLVKLGYKKTINYPPHLFSLLKWVWPDARLASQDFTRKFALKFPIFRNSNYT